MDLHSIQGSNSWAQFSMLANAAKVRNAGFNIPLAPQKTASTAKAKTIIQSKAPIEIRKDKFYTTNTPQMRKPILGANFDAYA